MELTNLPPELLSMLPQHLHNIEDFVNASSCCRTLRNAFARASPNVILQLAAASSCVFFRPDPHFLIAATARRLSDWALLSHENTESLRAAFRDGIDGLSKLCIARGGLTLQDIRRLHASRFSTINPLSDMIDRCAGVQWYSTPNFWDGGVSDAFTIDLEPMRALFQIAIYAELFTSSMRACIEPELNLPRFDLDMRLEYIKYCIPDSMCMSGYDGMKTLPTGPYVGGVIADADQVGLNHLLSCRTWREAWGGVRHKIGPDFDDEWRQTMWHSAVQMQGLEGLEILRPGGVEKWRVRLAKIRGGIAALAPESKPRVYGFGRCENPASDSPSMTDEIFVTVAGFWPQFS